MGFVKSLPSKWYFWLAVGALVVGPMVEHKFGFKPVEKVPVLGPFVYGA